MVVSLIKKVSYTNIVNITPHIPIVYFKSIKTEAVFTGTEMKNKANINFIENSYLAIQYILHL